MKSGAGFYRLLFIKASNHFMAKKLQLQVPTPCHENWGKMTLAEKGRFCASCQKQVIDFSNKSDREIAAFFKKPSTGSICGRFMEDQLNRDIEIPRKRIPWLKYFYQFLLPAFFISYRATAQGKVKVVPNLTTHPSKFPNGVQTKKPKIAIQVCATTIGDTAVSFVSKNDIDVLSKTPQLSSDSPSSIMGEFFSESPDTIKGRVIDETGKSVSFATVSIKGTKKSVVTDINGIFSISPKFNWEKVTLVTSSVGFVPQENQVLKANYRDKDTIVLAPMKFGVMGKSVVAGFVVSKKEKKKPIPLLQQIFRDSAFSKFRMYPNPIQCNSTLNIAWKQNQFGSHLLQLFNQSGQLVFSREISINEGSTLFTINMPKVIAGNYFLKLTSKATNKSEKLMVE